MATTVTIHEAETHLSNLIEQAERGEEVVISRDGKPVAKITALDQPVPQSRLGFLKGYGFSVPDDFNEMGREEIEKMFYGEE